MKPRRTIAAERARQTLGELINCANGGEERVVVTKNEIPAAAMVSMEDLRRLEELDVLEAA